MPGAASAPPVSLSQLGNGDADDGHRASNRAQSTDMVSADTPMEASKTTRAGLAPRTSNHIAPTTPTRRPVIGFCTFHFFTVAG